MKYIKNVYQIDKQIKNTSDKRVNPTYKTSEIISLVLTEFLLRVQSFNQLNFVINTGQFDNLDSDKDNIPKIDVIRNSLKSVSLTKIQVNKVLSATISMGGAYQF